MFGESIFQVRVRRRETSEQSPFFQTKHPTHNVSSWQRQSSLGPPFCVSLCPPACSPPGGSLPPDLTTSRIQTWPQPATLFAPALAPLYLTPMLTRGQPGTKAWHCQHACLPSSALALMFAAEHCAWSLASACRGDGAFVRAWGTVIYVMRSL